MDNNVISFIIGFLGGFVAVIVLYLLGEYKFKHKLEQDDKNSFNARMDHFFIYFISITLAYIFPIIIVLCFPRITEGIGLLLVYLLCGFLAERVYREVVKHRNISEYDLCYEQKCIIVMTVLLAYMLLLSSDRTVFNYLLSLVIGHFVWVVVDYNSVKKELSIAFDCFSFLIFWVIIVYSIIITIYVKGLPAFGAAIGFGLGLGIFAKIAFNNWNKRHPLIEIRLTRKY